MPAVDWISSFPDELICHILYFLPTKDVVATSVLSSRWRPLWRFVPVIDLSDARVVTNKETCIRFCEFVFAFLLSRDATQPIKRFALKCVYRTKHYSSDQNLNKWLNVVLQRRVEHLELYMHSYSNTFPIGALSCKTFVVLKLKLFTYVNTIISSTELPSLKTLHLGYLKFAQDRCLRQLLSGCPNLEDFQLLNVSSASHDDSFAEFKSLTRLMRADVSCCDIKSLSEALYNVEYLRVQLNKVLTPYCYKIPTFYNLTQINLTFCKHEYQRSIHFLKHCPKLQILEVKMMKRRCDIRSFGHPKFVPECVSLRLRECTIRNYGGIKAEDQFVRYIMRNAKVLQTMRIYCDDRLKLKMKEKLSLCKRGRACQLLIF